MTSRDRHARLRAEVCHIRVRQGLVLQGCARDTSGRVETGDGAYRATNTGRPSVHLVYFAIKVGARRLTDTATALSGIGHDQAAAVATRQARLVGSLQYDIVTRASESAAETLRRLAPTYDELAAALAC
jgi:hypothetical protein